jgi:hypothetical protein
LPASERKGDSLDRGAAAHQLVDMSESEPKTTLLIEFGTTQIEAIDAWIERHEHPRPTREEAVCLLIIARLGAEEGHPSTPIPGFVTGRDIV